MITFDTETCGLHGPIVLIQWARDDGEIYLHSPWKAPIKDTQALIEEIVNEPDGIVGFNLAFDWFHICQMYTTLDLFTDRNKIPEDHIEEYAAHEVNARFGPCLKPQKALDLMLHARKGPYQNTMNRSDIRIKKVPTVIAWLLAEELTKRIPLKDVYFARKKDRTVRWQIEDIIDDFGDINPDFKNIVLRFAPSSALKALAQDALGIDTESIKLFSDVEPPKSASPVEYGYAPFAKAIGAPPNWNGAYPSIIGIHINHWSYNSLAREYASDDVKYTRMLYNYFGRPDMDDVDSILACMVGAVRWRGYSINADGLKNLKKESEKFLEGMKFNFNSVALCKKYLRESMNETEQLSLISVKDGKASTKAVILEEIAKWKDDEICPTCDGINETNLCKTCGGDGIIDSKNPHPAALKAREILDARHAKKEIELYEKLLLAGRFHPSFTVIGTLSSRMSGGGGDLNPQGIKRANSVRSCFPLADGDLILCGGDFVGFEVTLADAAYNDPILRRDLLQDHKCLDCNGTGWDTEKDMPCEECKGTKKVKTKIHGLFGTFLFKGKTYEEILATKGADTLELDLYTRSKNGVFCMLYGGEQYSLQTRVGISEENANIAYSEWIQRYKVWGQERRKIFDMFCSMRQPKGIGTKVEWHEPVDYVESMFGFKRYFTLENKICKTLFEIGESPPPEWKQFKLQVIRRDRRQSSCGATQSALFAAAFAIQAANMRAGANHVIQSSGATLTKKLQKNLWDIQPAGINRWRIQPMNIHDEIMAPTVSNYMVQAESVVKDFITLHRERVPLLGIDWRNNLSSWAAK